MHTKNKYCLICKSTICTISEHNDYKLSAGKYGKIRFPSNNKKERKKFREWYLANYQINDNLPIEKQKEIINLINNL